MIHALESAETVLAIAAAVAIAFIFYMSRHGKEATLRSLDYGLPLIALANFASMITNLAIGDPLCVWGGVLGSASVVVWVWVQQQKRPPRKRVRKLVGEKGREALRRLSQALKPQPVKVPAAVADEPAEPAPETSTAVNAPAVMVPAVAVLDVPSRLSAVAPLMTVVVTEDLLE